MPQTLLFDVDGTLAETEEAHRQAFNEVFAEERVDERWPDAGAHWRWSRDLYERLLKTTGGKERIAAYLRDDLDLDPEPLKAEIAALHAKKTRRFAEILAKGGLSLRPGVAEIVDWARANGLTVAVATTTSRGNVDAVCRAGFGRPAEAVFDVIAAGDEVARKKPAPDVYQLALRRLDAAPRQGLALEDSRNGLRAAKAAGLRCVVCPGAYTQAEDFAEADLVVRRWTPEAVAHALAAPAR